MKTCKIKTETKTQVLPLDNLLIDQSIDASIYRYIHIYIYIFVTICKFHECPTCLAIPLLLSHHALPRTLAAYFAHCLKLKHQNNYKR